MLNGLITKHKSLITDRYKKLYDAYIGDYPILHQADKESYKPDNRVVVNFAKYIVDTFNGFFIGVPIKVSSKKKEIDDYINLLDKYNDQDDNNAELSKICSVFGKGYELYFNDDYGNLGITYLDPREGFMVYDESTVQKPRYFVTYQIVDEVMRGYIYDKTYKYEFNDKGGLHVFNGVEHGFNDIPATEFIENEEDLNYETLLHLHQKYQPTQVMIEYNGMWDNTKFVDEICIDQWQVVQILTTISAETFDLYYNNMRGQFVYHITGSDLVIVNRCDENTKKYPIRGSIKSLNPMCQIVYENKNRQIEDLTVNDLPYNLNDDYIEVNDMDYGIFCMHIMENPQIYENKTIKIKGKVIGRDKLIENGFVLGRQAMVCCSDDMQLLGLVCISKYAKDLIKDEWLVVDGTISLEYDESIQSNIPILHVDHLEGAKPLENEYVTFD